MAFRKENSSNSNRSLALFERDGSQSKVLVKMDKEFNSCLQDEAKNEQAFLSQMIRCILPAETKNKFSDKK